VLDWLYEGRQSVYLLLAALAVLVTALWARSGFVLIKEKTYKTRYGAPPRRKLAQLPVLLALLALLAAGYFLLDRLVETRREQIERKLQVMAAAVRTRNVDAIMEHISEQFRFQNMDRSAFRGMVDGAVRNGAVNDLVVWNVQFPDDSGRVTFMAKPKGSRVQDNAGFLVRAEFVQDADGQWRLRTFQVFFPSGGEPVTVPQIS
jgi:hypothetical protein